MKRILLYSVLLFAICISSKRTIAQSSCTQIILDSFRIHTDAVNPCLRNVYVAYTDPSSGSKSTRITITCGGTTVLDTCYNTALHTHGSIASFQTSNFTCCDISTLKIVIACYTGNVICLGTPCLTLISVGGGALPVYFKEFNANREGSAVDLQWTTASEENNRGFEVDRKIGNGDWAAIAFVNSVAPGGNSLSDINYSFVDENAQNEPSFYRLRQIDLDGRFSYSQVREIRGLKGNDQSISIYPNPGRNGQTTVSFADITQVYNITLVDATGRVLRQWQDVHGNNFHITGLLPGWYNLLVIAKQNGTQTVAKFIISR